MSGIFNRVEASFRAAMRGEESTTVLIKKWGIPAFLISFFVADQLVMYFDQRVVDVSISALVTLYFVWHIYVLKKCSPKKPKLTKEEKDILKRQARKDLGKKILRKLLLQEPVSEWNPVKVTIILDVLFIAQFLGYIFE
jgi:hypothetical protein